MREIIADVFIWGQGRLARRRHAKGREIFSKAFSFYRTDLNLDIVVIAMLRRIHSGDERYAFLRKSGRNRRRGPESTEETKSSPCGFVLFLRADASQP